MNYPRLIRSFGGIFVCWMPGLAIAHCTPLQVSVVDNKLTFASVINDPLGFAPQIYVDGEEGCGLEPAPSNRLITDIPGFDLSNILPGSGLYLTPIARTVSALEIEPTRFQWFWDPFAEMVTMAPNPQPLRLRSQVGFGETVLPVGMVPLPSAMQLASPLASDLGQHRHFLRYQLDNTPVQPAGVYGFFAQLTSPIYEASDPILIVLNSLVAADQLLEGALAINYVTGSGDFDLNGNHECSDVDALVTAIATHSIDLTYDLDGNGSINTMDLDVWLVRAGAAELPSQNPFLYGDANLDGVVDGSDFGAWNAHKFTNEAQWCSGDFNADGFIDGSDFGIWNARKFTSSNDAQRLVPEPVTCMNLLAFSVWLASSRWICRR